MSKRSGGFRRLAGVALAVFVQVCCVTVWLEYRSTADEEPVPAAPTVVHDPPVDASHVVGEQKCVDCHLSEYRDWLGTHHATATFDMLRAGEYAEQSREFAQELEIPLGELAKSSVCIRCHATPQIVGGRENVLPGVSCEACHGAAGGEDGWLNKHAVYGPTGTPRHLESPQHYQDRTLHCDQAGQVGVSSPFRLAVACYQCHLVWNEELVNVAEHPSGSDDFEFTAWSSGEVRHNYHMNQQENAIISTLWANPLWHERQATPLNRQRLLFVSGKLALLYVAMQHRTRATEDGDFVDDMDTNIEDAADELRDLVIDFSEDDEDEDNEYDPDDLPTLQVAIHAADRALEAVENIADELDDNDDLSDEEWQQAFYQRTAEEYRQAASIVQAAGVDFERTHDGSQLEIVDDDLPVITVDPHDEDNEAHYSDYWRAANPAPGF